MWFSKSLDGEKNKSMRQNVLVEQETRLLATKKLKLASNLGNNLERKKTQKQLSKRTEWQNGRYIRHIYLALVRDELVTRI